MSGDRRTRARRSAWRIAPRPPAATTPATLVFALLELAASVVGAVFLWRELGDVPGDRVATAWVLAIVGGLVAGYTWVVAAKHRLWGPAVDPLLFVAIDLLLLALAVATVGLMTAVHVAFGMIAIQGLLASMFLGSVRRSAAPPGCLAAMATGYGALLLVLGVMLYRELEADSTRTFGLGFASVLTLVMPGVRTLLMGVARRPS